MNKKIALVILESEDGGFHVQLSAKPEEVEGRFDNFQRVPNVLRGRATYVEISYGEDFKPECSKLKCKPLPDESHLDLMPRLAKGHRLGSGNPMAPQEDEDSN